MADYYRLEYNNQAIQGTWANEMFEIVPSTASLTGVIIDAMGGTDTIQVTDTNNRGFQATVVNLDQSSTIELASGVTGYYAQQSDGILVIDANGKTNLKLLGMTDTSIFSQGSTIYRSLNKNSTSERQYIEGTNLGDYIQVNHQSCRVLAYDGSDTVVAYTDYNSISGGNTSVDGDDLLILHGNNSKIGANNSTATDWGNDTLVSDGTNNVLIDIANSNLFIVGGDNNSATGGKAADTFWAYSYSGGLTNVTLTGGGNNDDYVVSTGLVGVSGDYVGSTAYNPYTADTVNVAITDFDSLDTLYIRDYGMTAIGHTVTSDGVLLVDDTGRINILFSGQRDWNAVKNALVTYDDAQGNIGTLTLEQAATLPIWKTPAGVYIEGDYMNISEYFVGNLLMSGAVNYYNGNIVTMDARNNPQGGMFLAGNENSNAIYAGYGGNVLWGGSGYTTTDYLYGGAGADIFMTGKNDGTDLIFNADVNDTINLYDTNLADLVNFSVNENSIALGWNTGNMTAIATSEVLSPRIQFASGEAFRFNRATGGWQGA